MQESVRDSDLWSARCFWFDLGWLYDCSMSTRKNQIKTPCVQTWKHVIAAKMCFSLERNCLIVSCTPSATYMATSRNIFPFLYTQAKLSACHSHIYERQGILLAKKKEKRCCLRANPKDSWRKRICMLLWAMNKLGYLHMLFFDATVHKNY